MEQKQGRDRAQPARDVETEIQRFVKHHNMECFYRSAMSSTPAPGKWYSSIRLIPLIRHFLILYGVMISVLQCPIHTIFTHATFSKGPMMSLMHTGKQCLTKRPLSMASISLCQKYLHLKLEGISTSCVNYI